MTSKIFTIQVKITVRKDYTVRATDEDEAIKLLQKAGIVSSDYERDREQYYNEDYEVIGTSETKKPDVE
jgi:hypothetical protein